MKRIFSLMFVGMLLFTSSFSGVAYAEEAPQENVIDKISDWASTVGKDKTERDRILAARKVERQQKHAEKKAAQMKKKSEKKAQKMGKDADATGKEMKKKMGL